MSFYPKTTFIYLKYIRNIKIVWKKQCIIYVYMCFSYHPTIIILLVIGPTTNKPTPHQAFHLRRVTRYTEVLKIKTCQRVDVPYCGINDQNRVEWIQMQPVQWHIALVYGVACWLMSTSREWCPPEPLYGINSQVSVTKVSLKWGNRL